MKRHSQHVKEEQDELSVYIWWWNTKMRSGIEEIEIQWIFLEEDKGSYIFKEILILIEHLHINKLTLFQSSSDYFIIYCFYNWLFL